MGENKRITGLDFFTTHYFQNGNSGPSLSALLTTHISKPQIKHCCIRTEPMVHYLYDCKRKVY